ncbi:hypothetical protein N9N67_01665 [Bacteriovoracaceae bacterium]|nr:hypothetical protein [Bacteriovoracaceae bacterium]
MKLFIYLLTFIFWTSFSFAQQFSLSNVEKIYDDTEKSYVNSILGKGYSFHENEELEEGLRTLIKDELLSIKTENLSGTGNDMNFVLGEVKIIESQNVISYSLVQNPPAGIKYNRVSVFLSTKALEEILVNEENYPQFKQGSYLSSMKEKHGEDYQKFINEDISIHKHKILRAYLVDAVETTVTKDFDLKSDADLARLMAQGKYTDYVSKRNETLIEMASSGGGLFGGTDPNVAKAKADLARAKAQDATINELSAKANGTNRSIDLLADQKIDPSILAEVYDIKDKNGGVSTNAQRTVLESRLGLDVGVPTREYDTSFNSSLPSIFSQEAESLREGEVFKWVNPSAIEDAHDRMEKLIAKNKWDEFGNLEFNRLLIWMNNHFLDEANITKNTEDYYKFIELLKDHKKKIILDEAKLNQMINPVTGLKDLLPPGQDKIKNQWFYIDNSPAYGKNSKMAFENLYLNGEWRVDRAAYSWDDYFYFVKPNDYRDLIVEHVFNPFMELSEDMISGQAPKYDDLTLAKYKRFFGEISPKEISLINLYTKFDRDDNGFAPTEDVYRFSGFSHRKGPSIAFDEYYLSRFYNEVLDKNLSPNVKFNFFGPKVFGNLIPIVDEKNQDRIKEIRLEKLELYKKNPEMVEQVCSFFDKIVNDDEILKSVAFADFTTSGMYDWETFLEIAQLPENKNYPELKNMSKADFYKKLNNGLSEYFNDGKKVASAILRGDIPRSDILRESGRRDRFGSRYNEWVDVTFYKGLDNQIEKAMWLIEKESESLDSFLKGTKSLSFEDWKMENKVPDSDDIYSKYYKYLDEIENLEVLEKYEDIRVVSQEYKPQFLEEGFIESKFRLSTLEDVYNNQSHRGDYHRESKKFIEGFKEVFKDMKRSDATTKDLGSFYKLRFKDQAFALLKESFLKKYYKTDQSYESIVEKYHQTVTEFQEYYKGEFSYKLSNFQNKFSTSMFMELIENIEDINDSEKKKIFKRFIEENLFEEFDYFDLERIINKYKVEINLDDIVELDPRYVHNASRLEENKYSTPKSSRYSRTRTYLTSIYTEDYVENIDNRIQGDKSKLFQVVDSFVFGETDHREMEISLGAGERMYVPGTNKSELVTYKISDVDNGIINITKYIVEKGDQLNLTLEEKIDLYLKLTKYNSSVETDNFLKIIIEDAKKLNRSSIDKSIKDRTNKRLLEVLETKIVMENGDSIGTTGYKRSYTIKKSIIQNTDLKIQIFKLTYEDEFNEIVELRKRGEYPQQKIKDFFGKLQELVPELGIEKDGYLEQAGLKFKLNNADQETFVNNLKISRLVEDSSIFTLLEGSLGELSEYADYLRPEDRLNILSDVMGSRNIKIDGSLKEHILASIYKEMKFLNDQGLLLPKSDDKLVYASEAKMKKMAQNGLNYVVHKLESKASSLNTLGKAAFLNVLISKGEGAINKSPNYLDEVIEEGFKVNKNSHQGLMIKALMNKLGKVEKHFVLSYIMAHTESGIRGTKSGIVELFSSFGLLGERFAQFASVLKMLDDDTNEALADVKSNASSPSKEKLQQYISSALSGEELEKLNKGNIIDDIIGCGSANCAVRVNLRGGGTTVFLIQKENLAYAINAQSDLAIEFVLEYERLRVEAVKAGVGPEGAIFNPKAVAYLIGDLRTQSLKELDNREVKAVAKIWQDLIDDYTKRKKPPVILKTVGVREDIIGSQKRIVALDEAVGKSWGELTEAEKKLVGPIVTDFYLDSLMTKGVIQGDPHTGNMLFDFTKDPPVVTLIDVMQTEQLDISKNPFKADELSRVTKLFRGLDENDEKKIFGAFASFAENPPTEYDAIKIQSEIKRVLNSNLANFDKITEIRDIMSSNNFKPHVKFSLGLFKELLYLEKEGYVDDINAALNKYVAQRYVKDGVKNFSSKLIKAISGCVMGNPKPDLIPGGN